MQMLTMDSIIRTIQQEIAMYKGLYRREPDIVGLGTLQCEVIEEYLRSNKFSQSMTIEKNTICGLKIVRSIPSDRVSVYKEFIDEWNI